MSQIDELQPDATPEDIQAAMEEAVDGVLTKVLAVVSPPIGGVLKYFRFKHLPPKLREQSCVFAELACRVASGSSNPETTVALRKLLESKDAAVRALLP
jgi:hypothetical protein